MRKTLIRLANKYRRSYKNHSSWYLIAGFLLVYAITFAVSFMRLDPDFGWHLVTGKYILSHGIPRQDFFSYTAKGHPWVDHEWGSDLILAILYNLGGYFLSAAFFALIWSGGLFLLAWRSRLVVLMLAGLALTPYVGIRPIAWSILLFALTYRIIKSNRKKWRLALPLLFMVWANLHAGFIAGLALIAYFTVIDQDFQLGLIFFVSALATLINAYGIKLYAEIGHTLFDPTIHKYVNEWRVLFIATPSRLFISLWAVGFLWLARPFWRRFISLGPLLLVSGLAASRNFTFFVITVAMDLDRYISLAISKIHKSLNCLSRLMLGFVAVLLVCLVAYTIIETYLPYNGRFNDYPTAAVSYLQTHKCPGNLFNDYNFGGYLIWKLPDEPVFIDGRMTTWTGYFNNYISIINHPAKNYPKQFNRYDIRCVLLQQSKFNQPLINTLVSNHWHLISNANDSVLLEQ